MNSNNSPKFLCNQNEDILLPVNSQFSGIFNKALFTQENVNLLTNRLSPISKPKNNRVILLNSPTRLSNNVHLNHDDSTVTTESSCSSTIDYEFLQPHTKSKSRGNKIVESPNKEINLAEYFGKFLERPKMLQKLSEQQLSTLRKITADFPGDGDITFKLNLSDALETVVYSNRTRTAIRYNIMTPESMCLLKESSSPSTSSSLPLPVKRKVGRPRNDSKRPIEKPLDQKEQELINHRTKSGRIVKLKPEIAKKIFQMDPKQQNFLPIPDVLENLMLNIPVVQLEVPSASDHQLLPGLKEPSRKPRKISSEFRCTSCKKIYLGKNKMNHHFKLFPDHRPKSINESVLFSHLMTMARQKKSNQEIACAFLKELSMFVEAMQKLTPKLITNNEIPNSLVQSIDKNAASLLRINAGEYRLNMNVFDKSFKLDNPIEPMQIEEQHTAIHNDDENHDMEPVIGNEVIKALDDVPSLDGNEVNLLIRQTNELTNLTNISDIVGENSDKLDDNALLGFLN